MGAYAVECLNLTKIFKAEQFAKKHKNLKDKVAVNNLSFQVNKGEVYGLLGPNGAGKTTTLRMLATLISPNSGEILINGQKLRGDEIRRKIGFLTDELKQEEFFSANYYYHYYGSLYGMTSDEIETRKKDIFVRLGIDEFENVPYGQLSTGMKQKVSLAIAVVHNPDIIIFDEPTNGLDIIASKNVMEFLKEMKNDGKTIILSTHIFSIVEDICDRVGILLDGRMSIVLDVKEVLKKSTIEDEFFNVFKGVE